MPKFIKYCNILPSPIIIFVEVIDILLNLASFHSLKFLSRITWDYISALPANSSLSNYKGNIHSNLYSIVTIKNTTYHYKIKFKQILSLKYAYIIWNIQQQEQNYMISTKPT